MKPSGGDISKEDHDVSLTGQYAFGTSDTFWIIPFNG
jgi:hypothetical protein